MSDYKLYSEIVDERITFEQFEIVEQMAGATELEGTGERTEITERYGYGVKEAPVDAAETVLKVVDDPSWETLLWEQSFLRGGAAEMEGVERAVENRE